MATLAEAYVQLGVKGASAVTSALSGVGNHLNRIAAAAQAMSDRFRRAMKALMDSIGSGFINGWTRFAATLSNANALAGQLVGRFSAVGRRAGAALVDGLRSAMGATGKAFTDIFPNITAKLTIGFYRAQAVGTQTAAKIRAAFTPFSAWVASAIPAAFNKAMTGARSALGSVATAAQAVGAQVSRFIVGGLNAATTAARALGAAIAAAWGNTIPIIGGVFNFIRSGISGVVGLAGKLAGALLTPFSMLKNFMLSWRVLLASLGVGFGVAEIGKGIAEVTAEAERAQIAFSIMLGGIDKGAGAAKVLLAQIQKLADTTPLEGPELRDAAKTLLAMGVAAGDVTKTLTMVGDVASGLKMPIGDLAQIFGKVRLANKIQGEEFRQLSERGVPVVEELARKLGVSTQRVYELGEEGKVTFKDFYDVMVKLTSEGGRFHGMLGFLGSSLEGKYSTLRDTIRAVARSFGEQLAPAAKRALDWSIQFAGSLRERLAPLTRMMASMADALVAKLPMFDNLVTQLMPTFEAGLRAAHAVMTAMNEIASAIGKTVLSWVGGTKGVSNGVMQIIRSVQFLAENWRAVWDIATAYAHDFWQNTATYGRTVFEQLSDNISKMWSNLLPAIQTFIDGIKSAMKAAVYSARDAIMGTNLYGDVIEQEQRNAAKSFELAAKQAKMNALRDMPGFNLEKAKPSKELQDALKRFEDLRKVFDIKEKFRPVFDKFQELWDRAKQMFEDARAGGNLPGAVPAMAAASGGSKGESHFMGIVEYTRKLQESILNGGKDTIAKEQLDVQKRQLAILQQDQQDRRNREMMPWSNPATFVA